MKIAVGRPADARIGLPCRNGSDVVGWAADFVEQNRWLVPAITGVSTALGALTVGVVTATVVVPALESGMDGPDHRPECIALADGRLAPCWA